MWDYSYCKLFSIPQFPLINTQGGHEWYQKQKTNIDFYVWGIYQEAEDADLVKCSTGQSSCNIRNLLRISSMGRQRALGLAESAQNPHRPRELVCLTELSSKTVDDGKLSCEWVIHWIKYKIPPFSFSPFLVLWMHHKLCWKKICNIWTRKELDMLGRQILPLFKKHWITQ